MITGDHASTARAIGRELDIFRPGDLVVTGEELDEMDDAALDDAARTTSVFARVSPLHKLRIVRALQHAGEVTAMTGDGVNDAPALKAADISVAMGITGTDVAKDASDMILMDDRFTTIVYAVRGAAACSATSRRWSPSSWPTTWRRSWCCSPPWP